MQPFMPEREVYAKPLISTSTPLINKLVERKYTATVYPTKKSVTKVRLYPPPEGRGFTLNRVMLLLTGID